ncbi:MAG TPA: glycoside hydrolase family 38 C-terminal domain-containing protein [Pyrinomonadaceae bacterium]|nr:glycoside hydrolase family 38 C-terminal domain-containing protein [Pyrinomonadaceae bacterium]
MRPLTLLLIVLFVGPVHAQTDLSKEPTLYVVAYSHLDTQWRWEYPRVINDYIPKTMHDNFALLDKYPHYVFNFSGANRYRMMKEYWPADYARVKQYVAAGRWFPAGSSVEESDVNVPSAESIFRQILYGNQFFKREFGKTSAEYMLPDCFGFPASLPSILAHAGIKGFSTQKLTWNSAAPEGGPGSIQQTPLGIPFNVGWWQGPDGRGVIAALNPGSYGGQIRRDISNSPNHGPNGPSVHEDWPHRVYVNGNTSGVFTDYHYYGTGDTGGAPREDSVRMLEAIVTRNPAVVEGTPVFGDGPIKVVSATAEEMFLNIRPDQITGLPRYEGDLLLTDHSAGSITSQSYQKYWNRQNELLADAAEKASVGAALLGSRVYPQQRLNDAWTLVMGGQFHDILPGTSTPKAFEFSWNDDVIALNQFASVLTSATEGIAAELDTQSSGAAIVVYNPLNVEREDVVEASVLLPPGRWSAVTVLAPDGHEVPSQVIRHEGERIRILFVAKVPSVGYAVYSVFREEAPLRSNLKTGDSSLENHRYRLQMNNDGDVASIFDKKLNRELLAAPMRLAIKNDTPAEWPAWNMDWADQQKPPRAYVGRVSMGSGEYGAVRASIYVEREFEGSKFYQSVRLSEGDAGNRVEFSNVIEWKTSNANLKATFPLAASNPKATYNWDIGTIQRGNNDERKFEVPSHQWFDLTDKSGTFGVTILSDCKYGSDKPDDNTLRLTLLRTPGIGPRAGYADQATQDWGRHEFVYGLAAHSGDWRRDQTDWHAQRLNQPLIAFQSSKHPGRLGKTFSIMKTNTNRVRVLALKKAEESDELIVRIVELDGREAPNVRLSFASPVIAAREVNAQEQPIRDTTTRRNATAKTATISQGQLVTSLTRFQPRTFALKLAPLSAPKSRVPQVRGIPIPLPYDLAVATRDGERIRAGFDGEGSALPAEMLPQAIRYGGISFQLKNEKANALVPRGQTIQLPAGTRRLYVLAASAGKDEQVTFRVGNEPRDLTIQSWNGFVGQWDNRQWKRTEVQLPPRTPPPDVPPDIAALLQRSRTRVDQYGEMIGITPAFIKRAPLAWFASHHHTAAGTNEAYAYSYLFAYEIEVPANARVLTLPNNEQVRILAITASNEQHNVTPARELYGLGAR